jgi:predicted 3-demethylubiquinone-9 3-methyltransferase (glyoxalase superfamily)
VRQITPHLWFDQEAVEAANFYTKTFPDSRVTNVSQLHDTPSGDVDVVSFELFGQPFMAISAGPLFSFTPSISFAVACATKEEVDEYWNRLIEGGEALMPLDSYPFSERYGWLKDRYGLSWQLMHAGEQPISQRITPTLMFVGDVCGKAEEAIGFYSSVFPNSAAEILARYEEGEEPDTPGTVKYGAFSLAGYQLAAMDSAQVHGFGFNEAISLMVHCDTQDQIDHYWEKLSAVPEAEQCGWLKDRYGVSWQIVPSAMDEMLANGTDEQRARVTAAFLQMKKFDIAELQRAAEGAEAPVGGEAR